LQKQGSSEKDAQVWE